MAYSDKTFFLTRLNADDLNKLTDSVDSNLTASIASADNKIDSYLATVIKQLPLNPVPDMVKQLSFDIAVYFLHSRTDFMDVPKSVKEKYDDSIAYLQSIADGKAQIPGLTTDQQSQNIILHSTDGNLIDRKTFSDKSPLEKGD